MEILFLYIHHRIQGLYRIQHCTTSVLQNSNYGRYLYMGGTVNMGGKVLYMVIHLYNSCTQYLTGMTAKTLNFLELCGELQMDLGY